MTLALGFDPGFGDGRLGWAVVESSSLRTRVLDFGTLRRLPSGDDERRLDVIAAFVLDRVGHSGASTDVVGYEDQAGMLASHDPEEGRGGSFASRRVLEVCGIIRCAAAHYGKPCIVVHSSTAKKTLTGSGRAKKADVQTACERLFGVRGASSHACDAIAIALTALRVWQARELVRQYPAKVKP